MAKSTNPFALLARRIIGGSGVICALLGAYCVTVQGEDGQSCDADALSSVRIPIPIRMEVVIIVMIGMLHGFQGLLQKTDHHVVHVVCMFNTINRKILTSK